MPLTVINSLPGDSEWDLGLLSFIPSSNLKSVLLKLQSKDKGQGHRQEASVKSRIPGPTLVLLSQILHFNKGVRVESS